MYKFFQISSSIYRRCLYDSVLLIREIRETQHAFRAINRSVVRTKATVKMSTELDIKKCFEFAKQLTIEAGEAMKCGFESEKNITSKTAEWDLVTDYDRKLEEMFTNAITKEYPDHCIIGEESSAEKKELPELTDAPTWIIDPIDGTMNFVHSFPYTCISVGIAVCKEVVIGIVYNPITSEMYTAIKGEGAFLNGKPIHTSKVTELKKSLLVLEPFVLKMQFKNKDIYVGRFEALLTESQGVRSTGSAALSLAYLAKGAIDCFHMDFLQPWDVAGGMLIAREAGATVTNSKGGKFDVMKPSTLVAATEALATEMSKLIIDTDLKTQRKRLQRT